MSVVRKVTIFSFLLIHFLHATLAGNNGTCFTAAVFERSRSSSNAGKKPAVVINESLHLYEQVTKTAAANGAQFILFPENGIFFEPYDRLRIREYLEYIPEASERVNPCEKDLRSSPIIYALSCLAKRYNIYLAANLGELKRCERSPTCGDGFHQYNTNVVFDSDGRLIAKYNKNHLYEESAYDFPPAQQFVYFDSPVFGRVGVFICFDMIFKEPGVRLAEKLNVTTMLFSTHWFDEAPFLAAHQYQQAWSLKNKVNLLAANINDLPSGSTGSGIYSGTTGAVNYRHDISEGDSVLLVAQLAKNADDQKFCSKAGNKKIIFNENTNRVPYKFYAVTLNNFNSRKLTDRQSAVKLCQNGFCCSLNYSVANAGLAYTEFYFAVTARIRKANYQWCERMCTLVAIDTRTNLFSTVSQTTFKHLTLKATFDTKYVYPSVLSDQWNLVPIDRWLLNSDGNTTELSVADDRIPLTNVGLYGRCYQFDPKYP